MYLCGIVDASKNDQLYILEDGKYVGGASNVYCDCEVRTPRPSPARHPAGHVSLLNVYYKSI